MNNMNKCLMYNYMGMMFLKWSGVYVKKVEDEGINLTSKLQHITSACGFT